MAGLTKLQSKHYHRPPLSKHIGKVHIDIQLPKRPKQAAVAEDKATYGNNN